MSPCGQIPVPKLWNCETTIKHKTLKTGELKCSVSLKLGVKLFKKWPSGEQLYAPKCVTPGVSAWSHISSISISISWYLTFHHEIFMTFGILWQLIFCDQNFGKWPVAKKWDFINNKKQHEMFPSTNHGSGNVTRNKLQKLSGKGQKKSQTTWWMEGTRILGYAPSIGHSVHSGPYTLWDEYTPG